MSEWKEYSLGEIYIVNSGLSKSKESFGFGETFISFKDVFYNWFLPENPKGLVNSNEKDQLTCSVKEGDILLTRTSETSDEIGMSSVALKDYPKSTFNGFCKRLRVKEDAPIKVSPLFIGYSLRSRIFRKSVAQYSTMTTRASLNGDSIRRIVLTFPPYNEQQEIGLILNKLDEKIELLQAQNKTLETIAQTIFKEWFGKYQIGDDLPEGWNEFDLGFVSTLLAGGDKPKNATKKITAINHIPIYSNGITNDGLYGFTDSPKVSEESVTVSARGTIGFVCLRNKPYVPIVRLISVVPNTNFLSCKYLFLWLKNTNISGTGTTQQQLTIPAFKNTKIIIPPMELINDFTKILDSLFMKIEKNDNQIQTLTKTRDTLLPKLMSGAIRVNTKAKV